MRWMIGFLILVIFGGASVAQEEDREKWYFAFEENVMITFTADGEMRTQPLDNLDSPYVSWRIDNNHMLMMMRMEDDTLEVWQVSPDAIQVFITGLTRRDVLKPVAYHHPYVVMTPVQPSVGDSPAWLINLDTGDVETLITGGISEVDVCCRFSDDGETLEYINRIAGEDARSGTLELRSRVLESGEERVLYSITTQSGVSVSFAAGDPWLMLERSIESGQTHYRLVDDTVTNVLTINSEEEPVAMYLLDGHLFSWYPRCETDCLYMIRNIETEAEYSYLVGTITDVPRPVYLFDEDVLIVRVGDAYLRLRPTAEPEVLGFLAMDRILTPSPVSSRWALLADDPQAPEAVAIWDFEADAPTRILPATDTFFNVFPLDGRFVVRDVNTLSLYAVDMATGELTEWAVDGVDIRTIVSDTVAIVWANGDGDLAQGFYRYDRESGDFTLLLEGLPFFQEGLLLEDVAP